MASRQSDYPIKVAMLNLAWFAYYTEKHTKQFTEKPHKKEILLEN